MLLFNLTWEETSQLDREMIVVVPLGSVEQHSYSRPPVDGRSAEGQERWSYRARTNRYRATAAL